jgi:hypothetical protein
MRRRDVLSLLGGAAVSWPLGARAQQQAMPVIGFLSSRSPSESAPDVAGFRQGLSQVGYVENQTDLVDQYRRAAGYVDRIIKGEKPADLPVQAPVKYELAVNLKTAKALRLTIPDTVIARAEEFLLDGLLGLRCFGALPTPGLCLFQAD